MKKVILFVAVALIVIQAQAQNRHGDKPQKSHCPKLYLGVTSGLNCGEGLLGVHLDAALPQNISIGGGVGLGTWGWKMSIDGRYYLKPCHKGWAFGAGLTRATGIRSGFSLDETVNGTIRTYNLKLNAINGLQLFAAHYWRIGKRDNRFNIQFGYNKSLTRNEYQVLSGGPISSSMNTVLNLISPGGLMFGTSFSFALGN